MTNPIVSVIIPSYNRRFLTKGAIECVLSQTFKNFEIIVIDDGSTDGTSKYIKSLKLPAKVVTKKNGGPASARNLGFKVSRGKYLCFLDSDDIWLPDFLKETTTYLDLHPNAPLVYSDYFLQLGNKLLKDSYFQLMGATSYSKKSFKVPAGIKRQAPIHISSTLFNRKSIEKVGLFNEKLRLHDDADMITRISEVFKLHHIDQTLAIYRLGIDNNHLLGDPELIINDYVRYIDAYMTRKGNNISIAENRALNKAFRNLDLLNTLLKLYKRGKISKNDLAKKRWSLQFFKLSFRNEFVLSVAGFNLRLNLRKTHRQEFKSILQRSIASHYPDFISSNRSYPDFSFEFVDQISKKDSYEDMKGKKTVKILSTVTSKQIDKILQKTLYYLLWNTDGFILKAAAIEIKGKVYLVITNKSLIDSLFKSGEEMINFLSSKFSIIKPVKNHYNYFQHPIFEDLFVPIKTKKGFPIHRLLFIYRSKSFESFKIHKEEVFEKLLDKLIFPDKSIIRSFTKFIDGLEHIDGLKYKNENDVINYLLSSH